MNIPQEIDRRVRAALGDAHVTAIIASAERDAAQEACEQAYGVLAECIRSDQVPDVAKVLEADPAFAAWYRARYGEK